MLTQQCVFEAHCCDTIKDLVVQIYQLVFIAHVCGFQSNKNAIDDVARAWKDERIDDTLL